MLTQQLWPVLGVPPPVHSALQAWILFRQYALCEDLALLEASQQLLAMALTSAPKPGPQHLLDNGFEDEVEGRGQAFVDDVGEAVADWVCRRLSNYGQHVMGGQQGIHALVEVLSTLHQSMGHTDALPDVSPPMLPANWD